ncbi:MAG: AbrB/MazE/SpoVT family DNA-binding domain-containing protein [Candidatus Delongbacteria bacterium]|nr:AbrB/MazE/SpoVT family DNA-binding domain-containing protein [Candidatus Delongbacteria bacterium]MCG2760201.1 AbrB/MazE/SpoVT family DNA-binding domain-containing protein [Candidatus Delongbacteria bacterium]
MTTATLTTKGQVTIPKEIRDSLNLHTGDMIEIIIINEGEAVIRPVTRTVDELFGKLHKKGMKTFTVEEMDEAIRKKVKEEFNESN